MAEVIIVDGGWAVHFPDHKGQPQYLGRDGYWTRIVQAVSPWKSKAPAEAMAADINKVDRPHVFR